MGGIVGVNGRRSTLSTEEVLDVNRGLQYRKPILVNGYSSERLIINGIERPPVLPGCVLNLPLYHPLFGNSTFKSLDQYEHECTNYGGLWLPNHGIQFDGTDDYVDCGDDSHLDVTTEDFSLVAWAKTDALSDYSYIFSKRSGTVGYEIGAATAIAGGLNLFIGDAGGFTAVNLSAGLNDLRWHHIVAAHDRDTACYVYVDSVLLTSIDFTDYAGSLSNAGHFYLGKKGTTQTMDGYIVEVQIVKGLLSAAHVKMHFNATCWRYR